MYSVSDSDISHFFALLDSVKVSGQCYNSILITIALKKS